jgi:hypothetical protein
MVAPALPLSPETQAQAFSVQDHPDPTLGSIRYGGIAKRGPLLGAKGSRTREWHLRQYFHHDYNLLFRGGNTVLVKQVQSTPWEIVAKNADPWQRLLMHADFGNWDRFIAKAVTDYSRHDAGAWIELIGPGDPRMPIAGPVVGMAVLDSLRVYPTGNPTYPAIYYDVKGRMHMMHKSRIVQLVDTEESEEDLGGYGDCALSRAIGAVHRQVLMGRYVEQFLDDKPPPGLLILGNLGEPEFTAAMNRMEKDRNTDSGGDWGHTGILYGLDTANKPTAEFLFNQKPPEKFDFINYSELDSREIALALGLDMQDVWGELTVSGLGQGTQTEILKQKARGKGLGRLLKAFERVINQALPTEVEFRWQYKDPEEDQVEADKALTWISVAQAAMASGVMDEVEARQLLANQVPGIQDVILDANGNLKRLPDDDPKPVGEPTAAQMRQVVNDAATPPASSPIDQIAENMGIAPTESTGASSPVDQIAQNMGIALRAFDSTADDFIKRFTSFVRVGQAQRFNTGVMRAAFRDELYQAGLKSYEDGLRAGGADPGDVTAIEQAERRRKASEWLSLQNGYITAFVNDVSEGKIAKAQIELRADMWVNKSLRSIYYVGLQDAAAEKKFRWVLGNTKQHCKTCSLLNGQVHKLKDWLKSGYSPQCTCLECKGFQCDCHFEETSEPIRGRLPGSNGIGGLRDLFSGFLSRMAGKGIEEIFAPHPLALGRYLQRIAA